jgi:branched-chain amino acid transport system permease protein
VVGIVALLVVNLRRSTTGLGVNAVRWSEPASRTLGLSVVQMKVLLSGIAAFVAAVGGGFLALYSKVALPANFATLGGMVWLAILVTVGIRSNVAAMFAGLSFVFVPALVLNYLPTSWGNVPPALFGLGAIFVARNPDGALVFHAQQIQSLLTRRFRSRSAPEETPAEVSVAPAAAETVPALANGEGLVDASRPASTVHES